MLAAELSVLPATDQRKAPRRIVNLAAALREEGATISSVNVLDISLGGCRLETEADLEVGGQVWLKLPGLKPSEAASSGPRVGMAAASSTCRSTRPSSIC